MFGLKLSEVVSCHTLIGVCHLSNVKWWALKLLTCTINSNFLEIISLYWRHFLYIFDIFKIRFKVNFQSDMNQRNCIKFFEMHFSSVACNFEQFLKIFKILPLTLVKVTGSTQGHFLKCDFVHSMRFWAILEIFQNLTFDLGQCHGVNSRSSLSMHFLSKEEGPCQYFSLFDFLTISLNNIGVNLLLQKR